MNDMLSFSLENWNIEPYFLKSSTIKTRLIENNTSIEKRQLILTQLLISLYNRRELSRVKQ
jgi:hypothetical protein